MQQKDSYNPVYRDAEESAGAKVEAITHDTEYTVQTVKEGCFNEQQLLNVGETASDQRKLPWTCATCVEKSRSNFKLQRTD